MMAKKKPDEDEKEGPRTWTYAQPVRHEPGADTANLFHRYDDDEYREDGNARIASLFGTHANDDKADEQLRGAILRGLRTGKA
jgi:hypothetical protein